MTFTTLTFLLFLVVVFALYWALPGQRARNVLIVVASYVFYGWWDARFCALMFASSQLDYWSARRLEASASPRWRRFWLALSCSGNLALLGFFKYYGFFTDNAAALARALGVELSFTTLNIVLPVGISFYTFQTMSYTIDVYRGRLPATRNVIDFLAYVAFFPQLVAGPIERAHHLLPQFQRERVFDPEQAREGLRFMLWGFFKKLAIADNLGILADSMYRNPADHTGNELLIGTVAFAFQIYADFSAYSDIAIGCARLLGFDLMRNFALPYFSTSVPEFWRRWHMSLSGWFSDYVYVSLGGNRVGTARRAANVMITFLLSGLWHGASWNFVVWGALNGAAVVPAVVRPPLVKARATDVPGGTGLLPSPMGLVGMVGTFAFVTVTWVYFRAATIGDAHLSLWRMATGLLSPWVIVQTALAYSWFTGLILVLVAVEWVQRRHWHPLVLPGWPRPLRWALYTLLVWATLGTTPSLDHGGRFIYFQF